jgi:DNA (cytosine-5)-methyltransferase 1
MQTDLHEIAMTLNCMHDQQIVMVKKGEKMNEEFMNPPEDDGEYAVRRLLPCECAALQGFPKDWCDDVPHSDSAEYKLWGNGIALPSILGIMQNAVEVFKKGDD